MEAVTAIYLILMFIALPSMKWAGGFEGSFIVILIPSILKIYSKTCFISVKLPGVIATARDSFSEIMSVFDSTPKIFPISNIFCGYSTSTFSDRFLRR